MKVRSTKLVLAVLVMGTTILSFQNCSKKEAAELAAQAACVEYAGGDVSSFSYGDNRITMTILFSTDSINVSGEHGTCSGGPLEASLKQSILDRVTGLQYCGAGKDQTQGLQFSGAGGNISAPDPTNDNIKLAAGQGIWDDLLQDLDNAAKHAADNCPGAGGFL